MTENGLVFAWNWEPGVNGTSCVIEIHLFIQVMPTQVYNVSSTLNRKLNTNAFYFM